MVVDGVCGFRFVCAVKFRAQVPKAKEMFDKASDILGYDLLDKCENGPKDVLDSTVSATQAFGLGARGRWMDRVLLHTLRSRLGLKYTLE